VGRGIPDIKPTRVLRNPASRDEWAAFIVFWWLRCLTGTRTRDGEEDNAESTGGRKES